MNKSLLCSGLLVMFCGSVQAADPVVTPPAAGTTPAKNTTQTVPAKPAAVAAPVVAPAPPQPVNCKYTLAADTKHVDVSLIKQWAEKAAQQSFDFDAATLDKQMDELKSCYTDQGWQSFYTAMQQSGNIKAIQSQNLQVSSMINGQVNVSEEKDNQWKVNLPLQVVYQNVNEKLTQTLVIDLLIGRKVSGNLGIMQIIASPRQPSNAAAAATPTAPVKAK